MRLGFNIDHVATIRNARGEGYPNLIEVANLAISCGASQITAHLREDRRHIKDEDIFAIKSQVKADLNMEMALTEEMVNIALKLKPHAVCLVPEKRQELTTEGGLDVIRTYDEIEESSKKLQDAGIKVNLFIDANPNQADAAISLKVNGIEINTGKYANLSQKLLQDELNNIQFVATLVNREKLNVHAGHGLNFNNVQNIVKIKEISELNIGHFLVANSILVGLEKSIKTMLQLMQPTL